MKKKLALIIGDKWVSGKEIRDILSPIFEKEIKFFYSDWLHNNLHSLQSDNLKIEKGGLEDVKLEKNFYKNIKKYNIIIVHFAPLKEEVFRNNINIEIVASLRSGLENICNYAKKQKNIKIINNPGRNANAVAEFTIAMMLNLNRQLYEFMYQTKKLNWPRKTSLKWGLDYKIGELKSSTIGLIGFGVIGRKVANILDAFGSDVLIYEPNKQKHVKKYKFTNLKDLLKRSDIISFHAKNDKEILDKTNFKFLKKNAYIINSSRAKLINEDLLIKYIKEKRIYGAAIDVFNEEPLPENHNFKRLKNVLITPHIAGATDQMLIDCVYLLSKKLNRIIKK